MHAAGRAVDGVNISGIESEEDAPADNAGLSIDDRCTRKAEGPCKLQRRHLLRCDSSGACRLKAVIVVIDTPAIPCRRGEVEG